MKHFATFIVTHKKLILISYLVIIILSFIGMRYVSIEYDLSSYLPKDMNSIKGRDILEKDFKLSGTAKLLIKSNDLSKVSSIKASIKNIPGVKNVTWLDDVDDILKQESFIDKAFLEKFKVMDYNLLELEFNEGNDDLSTKKALDKIDSMISEEHYIGGPAAVSNDMRDTSSREMVYYSACAFITILIILFLSSSSYLEPILFFVVLGVAILINMGTNLIFQKISSNTYSVASILQLAVSMDYSIFLLHRFHDELNTKNKKEAMVEAIVKTFSSVSASALTTVAGFLALVFMKYGIGKDMGLVLAKGVFISLITVITLLPVLALISEDRFGKYKHRVIIPGFNRIAKQLVSIRYFVLILTILIIIPVFLGQSKISYYYSTEKTLSKNSKSVVANNKINELFKNSNEMVLIIPKSDRVEINNITSELKNINAVASVMGMYSFIDPALPDIFIPESIKDRFESDKYTYLVINLMSNVESPETTDTIKKIHTISKKYYKEHYLTGEAPIYLDLKAVTSMDFTIVTIVSNILIALILFVTFKSLILPFILILVIQTGVWINVSIPYFLGNELNFISFIIIGAIQLGATVDYAILFTTRYKENLEALTPKKAAIQTIKDTSRSVLSSALILMAGTLSVYFITTIRSASELTLLIARGAAISLVLVYTLLPALLLLLKKPIKYTTLNWPEIK